MAPDIIIGNDILSLFKLKIDFEYGTVETDVETVPFSINNSIGCFQLRALTAAKVKPKSTVQVVVKVPHFKEEMDGVFVVGSCEGASCTVKKYQRTFLSSNIFF
jgi:hypothetical protein